MQQMREELLLICVKVQSTYFGLHNFATWTAHSAFWTAQNWLDCTVRKCPGGYTLYWHTHAVISSTWSDVQQFCCLFLYYEVLRNKFFLQFQHDWLFSLCLCVFFRFLSVLYFLFCFYLAQSSHIPSCFGAESPLMPPRYCMLGAGYTPC